MMVVSRWRVARGKLVKPYSSLSVTELLLEMGMVGHLQPSTVSGAACPTLQLLYTLG